MGKIAYVGPSALTKLRAHVPQWAPSTGSSELGIVSDLDKTVIPPAEPDLSSAPYPGVTLLLKILERRGNGSDGDVHYVTARTPDLMTGVPEYLDAHELPVASIDTGESGYPWLANPEKVADVSAVLDAAGEQRFILFGDSSHVDPEVYGAIRASYPNRILATFIHKVNNTVSPDRVEGMHLHEGYAEVAAILCGEGVLTRHEALAVMRSARDEGLAISDGDMQTLLDAHAP
jgi:phosphatidate phosphatase APP1